MTAPFTGFPSSLTDFLAELAANNDRDWFAENKSRYESLVLGPGLAFVEAMAGPLAEFAPEFRALPGRAGGSVMRVYRDVRFSQDKRPYKTNLGIQFRHRLGKDVHAPGYYFHLDPHEAFVAVGCWRPAAPALRAIREFIADNPRGWGRAREAAQDAGLALSGESLVRPPRGFDPGHAAIEDLKRKDFVAVVSLDRGALAGAGALEAVVEAWRPASPLVRFLCAALDVPF
jgi:uncharacterized protein (TIGR02453 family)